MFANKRATRAAPAKRPGEPRHLSRSAARARANAPAWAYLAPRRRDESITSATPRRRAPSDPAERHADAMGARIAAELRGAPAVSSGALPTQVQRIAERHLGVSLDGTQLVSDDAGHRRAAEAHARAVTEGSRISFLAGQLTTATAAGRLLLGHELTHVAQQREAGAARMQKWDLLDDIVEGIDRGAHAVGEVASGVATGIGDVASGVAHGADELVGGILHGDPIGGLGRAGSEVVEGISEGASDVAGGLSGAGATITSGVATWTCSAKCAEVSAGGSGCGGWLHGSGTGKTQSAACKAAKKDASSKAKRGCRAKHCKCSCTK
jgi:hypothetical protein